MLRLITTKVVNRSFQQIPSLLFCTYNKAKQYNNWDQKRSSGNSKFKPEVDRVLNLQEKKNRKGNEDKFEKSRNHQIVINWEEILQNCDEDVKKLILLTQKNEKNKNQDKVSMKLKILIQNIITYKPVIGIFDYIILLAALHENENVYLRD